MKTNSENICNELGAKFFCKDYVYENLYYYDIDKNKKELCDGLFDYAGTYIVLQIKERSKTQKGTKTNEQWLQDIVYSDKDSAKTQIIKTIETLKNNDLIVNDLYHQKVQLHKDYLVYPVIVFDNDDINTYNKTIDVGDYIINVFNLKDFKIMMEVLGHPYDIFYYLKTRCEYLNETSHFPMLFIGDGETTTTMSHIDTEQDFAYAIFNTIYDGKAENQNYALTMMKIIKDFREKEIKHNINYKKILEILQLIEPRYAKKFVEDILYGLNQATSDKFDATKGIKLIPKNYINNTICKPINIIFVSTGLNIPKEINKYCHILSDAKQLKYNEDCVILLILISGNQKEFYINWAYYENTKFVYDEKLYEFWNYAGMYNGSITKNEFEKYCDKFPYQNI